MDDKNVLKTGTTTVGIVCKEGVVLAADKRATAGNLIATKKTEKIHLLTDNIAVTMAGTASDAQLLVRYSQSEFRLKKIRTGQEVSAKEGANLLARLVYSNIRKMSMIPGISHFLLAGKDDNSGFELYDIYADGSISLCDDFIASGSGSVMAYGVLETLYKPNMSIDDGVKMAVQCINAAIQRDSASGNGIDVVTITKDGAKKVLAKEIEAKVSI